MKKIYLIIGLLTIFLLVLGCQPKVVEKKSVPEATQTTESVTPSAEEVEVSQGLDDMNDLDQLEKEINELEVEDLGNTTQ